MKNCPFLIALSFTLTLVSSIYSQSHPGYDITTIRGTNEPTFDPLVGDMEFLSDGRLVVTEWGVPANVYIYSGLTGDFSNVRVDRFATGLDNVLGMTVVNDVIYIMERQFLTQLIDLDADGTADEYNTINYDFATGESMLAFSYDLVYMGGYFYSALSADVAVGGYTYGSEALLEYGITQPPIPGRATFLKMSSDGTTEEIAAGLRNPNGVSIGFGNQLFATENQGSWMPSSKVNHIKPGRFYGHRTNPPHALETGWWDSHQAEAPPAVWLPHGDVSLSVGHATFIPSGRFENQFLIPETDKRWDGRIIRASMEEVDGELQGACYLFVKERGGMMGGNNRLRVGPDGHFYVGMLGCTGGWNERSGMDPGLQVLSDNNDPVFEILAVRSLGPDEMEIEFTERVASDADQTGNYLVESWTHTPMELYGGGNKESHEPLSVNSATVSTDRLKVVLNISNMQEGYLIYIMLDGLQSETGQTPFAHEAWYTLNAFGPGTDPEVVGVREGIENTPDRDISIGRAPGGKVLVDLAFSAPYHLELLDLKGKRVSEKRGSAPEKFTLDPKTNTPGIYIMKVTAPGKTYTKQVPLLGTR
jgi:hypothetical protein